MRVEDSKGLGVTVRERRAKLGITQATLAAAAGVSRRWLSDLEAGKVTAELGLVLRTLRALGIVVDLQPEERLAPIDLDAVLAAHRRPPGPGHLDRPTDADLMVRSPKARRTADDRQDRP
jgi:HTH-type transcriptional regulator/antitoxin HipB